MLNEVVVPRTDPDADNILMINSFNEWHEGSQFEPARDYADLTPEERRYGYHNPPDGMARLRDVGAGIGDLVVHLLAIAKNATLFAQPEGSRTLPFTSASFEWGTVTVGGQSLLVVLTSLALIFALALFFNRTLYGRALRATAVNRVGARLAGISPTFAGTLTFTLGALVCAFCGVLIGPITTIYYDSGFLISLKGFVGAIIGGLSSYPLAAAGSLLVGLIESFSSFWASAFKEVIVFTLIIPVLLWRSLTSTHHDEDE